MGRNLHLYIAIIITVLCCVAGSTTALSPLLPQEQVVQTDSPVSITDTPIQYARVNGVDIAYREFGSGDPLLVIVGFGATMEQANDTAIGIFASKYHVFLYDHRGMGHSGSGNITPTIGLYAEDAADLIEALGYDSMHIYGTSMGSMIAQELAISHPDRVRKMILDSNTYSLQIPETQSLRDYVEAAASDPASPQGLKDEANALLAWNGTWDRLPGISKDVMLVVGTNDTVTPDILSVRMAAQINSSWLVRFRDLPHAGGDLDPVKYGRNALYFLDTPVSWTR